MAADLELAAKDRGIKYFLVSFTDLFGVQRAKLVPTAAMGEVVRVGAAFGGFATWLDMTPADADMLARPDASTLVQLPWKPEVGWMAADLWMEGEPVAQSPRQVLKRLIGQAADAGFELKSGVECEFFLLNTDGTEIADTSDRQAKACYDQASLMRRYDVIAELSDAMLALGWKPYQSDHEDAHGQFEMNWAYDGALVTADRHTFFKFMLKSVAEKHGLRATFMPKPFAHLPPTGCHAHVSLWRDGANLFLDEAGELGLSQLAYQFLGGILAHAEALAGLTNPTVNSYKRLNAPVLPTGQPLGPGANAITYGGANRTHLIRIPAPGRFEIRIGDGAVNPYLLQAAYLAAGLDGIASGIDPGQRLDVHMFEEGRSLTGLRRLPTNLLDAVRALDRSDVLRARLGASFVDAYVKLKTMEWDAFCASLSEWERLTTLDC
ncbi:MAG TPA: type III glutamate--ammonia ligase [Caulobacteraceae bacterium]|jgi:glutamine synthetase|nr:type III glutamate--ammonia ligase [Caulobacteraceae bacterium]